MTEAPARRRRVFYMHIAKTAGTSVARGFASVLGEEACRSHVQSILRDDVLTPRQVVRQFQFVAGHLSLPKVAMLTAPDRRRWFVFTTVREPLSHVVSHVKWVKAQGLRARRGAALGLPADIQTLAHGLSKLNLNDIPRLENLFDGDARALTLFHDCQTRYFLPQTSQPLTNEDLEAALQSARAHLDLVLRTEELAERLPKILARFGGEPDVRPPQENQSPLEEAVDLSDPKVRAFYDRLTQKDQALYATLPRRPRRAARRASQAGAKAGAKTGTNRTK